VSAARRLLHWIGCCERAVAICAFSALTLALVADVLRREVTGVGIFAAPRVAVYGMLGAYLAGLGLASSSGSHLRPRFADTLLPAAWRAGAARCGQALTALFCLCFAALAVQVAAESHALGEITIVPRWPVWPSQAAFALAFGVAALRHAIFALWPALAPADATTAGAAGAAGASAGSATP